MRSQVGEGFPAESSKDRAQKVTHSADSSQSLRTSTGESGVTMTDAALVHSRSGLHYYGHPAGTGRPGGPLAYLVASPDADVPAIDASLAYDGSTVHYGHPAGMGRPGGPLARYVTTTTTMTTDAPLPGARRRLTEA